MQNTGNFWIDNGYAQLSLLWGQEWASNDSDQVLTSLAQQIYTPTGNQGEYYDKATSTIKQYNKRNWKPPTNLFISVSDNPEKVIVDGKTYYTTPPQTLCRKFGCNYLNRISSAIFVASWLPQQMPNSICFHL